ncbi:ribose 5-phosphate isomerase B [candidate division WOR-1 bacterium RIFOXYA12_FULL_52_29]|uniref:Ribose 5-phosphate isomerase B n=1 Tax=candidate division WOR-1 bacterium RIFOXYC12_FULL_54_18 TaxID=1802584 RepID=A0A1F4T4T0_UNCSA|nr:MAG: ribose 5-phosphate isomerase B [candidate division WOR-1 bacterium RIFOXYA2_FULL_51_19]OGC17149.1 MAG: ribose 5-phosphate isomerase B [candidate division WOR-1 bacterium RIFOXYA12_FULL_52_29]OGC26009.1 MAG: ribose 5-phosphate isomerase B [candidate division WOR-1 bacterium RIFOXYB2_FULL_45_9]OGC27566.1 MAG: ribose 5-phosphate isomerase B [candidate division WOR-1 bacterium RIFOXYC12_FULL_54_18]OGC29221.1 MAG: ribose 5-phosphate isomerase B [candidate division WOR-1 bacterium RIFOXYB12_F
MKIALASDHAGFAAKELVKKHLADNGIEFKDFGAHSEESVDYPDFAYPAARAVAKGEFDRGIFVCGSGVGVTIVANKVKGIRAVNAGDIYTAKQSREHGDCNVLCLAGKRLSPTEALAIVDAWLKTEFSGDERHLRRIRKIDQ